MPESTDTLIVRAKINICNNSESWDAGAVFETDRDWALKEIKLKTLEEASEADLKVYKAAQAKAAQAKAAQAK
jgi:hypothetical protein